MTNYEANPERFADLLKAALKEIKKLEGKNVAQIEDEIAGTLGRVSGSIIQYWKKGNIPSSSDDLEQLTRELHKRAPRDMAWLNEFLVSGGHSQPELLLSDISPLGFRNIDLVGRTPIIDRSRDFITSNKSGNSIIGIDGMGGIGKTKLALKIAASVETFFRRVVEIRLSEIDRNINSFEMFADKIIKELSVSFSQTDQDRRFEILRHYFRIEKTLLVIDNFEIVHKSKQEEIVETLNEFLENSKAILVGRRRFVTPGYVIHLKGLKEDECFELARNQAKLRTLSGVRSLTDQQNAELYKETGGAPLAIQLIVSQLDHVDFVSAIKRLKQPRLDTKDEYERMYRRVLWSTWDLLETDDLRRFLIQMGTLTTNKGNNISRIMSITDGDASSVEQFVEQLWRASLVEVDERSPIENTSYYLHSLTKHFVTSDILKQTMKFDW